MTSFATIPIADSAASAIVMYLPSGNAFVFHSLCCLHAAAHSMTDILIRTHKYCQLSWSDSIL